MLIDDGNRVFHELARSGHCRWPFVQVQLLQMVAQLIEQAFAQVATGDALRIELAHNFQRFVQIGDREVYIRKSGRAQSPLPWLGSVARRGRRNLSGYARPRLEYRE
jgi:hypothetical protein